MSTERRVTTVSYTHLGKNAVVICTKYGVAMVLLACIGDYSPLGRKGAKWGRFWQLAADRTGLLL